MTLRELESICKPYFYLYQLFSMKRCFGSQATLNFVDQEVPLKTHRCRTIPELVAQDVGVPSNMAMFDELLQLVNMYIGDDHELRTASEVFESPWTIAEREQEAARIRRDAKRAARLALMSASRSADPFDYCI